MVGDVLLVVEVDVLEQVARAFAFSYAARHEASQNEINGGGELAAAILQGAVGGYELGLECGNVSVLVHEAFHALEDFGVEDDVGVHHQVIGVAVSVFKHSSHGSVVSCAIPMVGVGDVGDLVVLTCQEVDGRVTTVVNYIYMTHPVRVETLEASAQLVERRVECDN